MSMDWLGDLDWFRNLDWRDPYTGLGLALMVFGAPFMVYSHYVLLNVTYAALGMACLILGSVFLLTPASPVPLDAVRALMDGAYVNIEAILEELDLKEKAVYLTRDVRVYCFIPFHDNFKISDTLRLVQDDGLMIFTPVSELISLGDVLPEGGLENSMSSVLVDYLEACDSVKSVMTGDDIVVSISNPVLGGDYPRIKQCLGSFTVNVSGSVLAYVLGESIRFVDERVDGSKITSRFRVIRLG